MHFVYVLRCADDSFYIGLSRNLDSRVKEHNDSRGAAYTSNRRPVRLVYWGASQIRDEAITREQELKRWSRAKKQALIEGDIERLKRLSRRRS